MRSFPAIPDGPISSGGTRIQKILLLAIALSLSGLTFWWATAVDPSAPAEHVLLPVLLTFGVIAVMIARVLPQRQVRIEGDAFFVQSARGEILVPFDRVARVSQSPWWSRNHHMIVTLTEQIPGIGSKFRFYPRVSSFWENAPAFSLEQLRTTVGARPGT